MSQRPDSVTRIPGVYELRGDGERLVIFGPADKPGAEEYHPPWLAHWKDYPRVHSVIHATSWVDAKMLFGFTLSALQQRMLRGQATYFELTGHFWGESDDTSPSKRDQQRNREKRRAAKRLPREDVDSDRRDAATQAFLNGAGISEADVAAGLVELPGYVWGASGAEVGGDALVDEEEI